MLHLPLYDIHITTINVYGKYYVPTMNSLVSKKLGKAPGILLNVRYA